MELALPRPLSVPRPRWDRAGLAAVLGLAAALVLVGLTESGYSNTYYAAAVKSASESWKALFFGSVDPASFITVDKPPLAIWLMGLSARVFGFSSFSMLLPQALCTVGAVALLHATVKRATGSSVAALVSALMLAVTPITVAIGRVNNPDALLVLLLVAAAYFTVRAIESGRTRHLALAGAMVGLAFMTKMLQGWMVLPALALAYVLFASVPVWQRVRQLLAAGAVMVAVSAAWPVAVSLWPGSAPYIGGSTDGSVWDLILGYNGLGRIFGEGGGGRGGMFGGEPGLWRMFNAQVAGNVAWLLPLAGAGLVAGLARGHRALFALFGTWAVVHLLVFSFARGIFHPYYVSALAPAVAVLAGAGGWALVKWARTSWAAVALLEAAVLVTAWLAVALLARTPDFAPWLSPVIGGLAVATAFMIPLLRTRLATIAVVGLLAVLAAPAAYSVATASHALDGNDVTAGPARGQKGQSLLSTDAELVEYLTANRDGAKYLVAAMGSQAAAPIILATGEPVVAIGGFGGRDAAPTLAEFERMVADGEVRYVLVSGGGPGGSSEISQWVQQNGTETTISGLYRV